MAFEYEKIPELHPLYKAELRELQKQNDDLRLAIKIIKNELKRLQEEKQDV